MDGQWWEAVGPNRYVSGLLDFEATIQREPAGSWTAILSGLPGDRSESKTFMSEVEAGRWL